ncbi:MAG: hypothetical protein WC683_08450 [bacterium]|nr:hypothetical protein [Dehalococcoidales bacterium]
MGDNNMTQRDYIKGMGYWEVAHWLSGDHKYNWSQKELLTAKEKAECRNTGWPIGVTLHREDARPKYYKDSIAAIITSNDSYDEWKLKRDGSFYFMRVFGEDIKRGGKKNNILFFDVRIWRITEALLHCQRLYTNLGVEPTVAIRFDLNHYGLSNRVLTASNPDRAFSMNERTCHEDELDSSLEFSLLDLTNNIESYSVDLCKELFILFDGWEPAPGVIEGVIADFMRSRI